MKQSAIKNMILNGQIAVIIKSQVVALKIKTRKKSVKNAKQIHYVKDFPLHITKTVSALAALKQAAPRPVMQALAQEARTITFNVMLQFFTENLNSICI